MWSCTSLTKELVLRDVSKARLSGGARVQEGPLLVRALLPGDVMGPFPYLPGDFLHQFAFNSLASLSRGHLFFFFFQMLLLLSHLFLGP